MVSRLRAAIVPFGLILLACVVCAGHRAAAVEKISPVTQWDELIPPDDIRTARAAPSASLFHRNKFGDDAGSGAAGSMGSDLGVDPSIDHSSPTPAPQFGSFRTIASLDGRRAALTGFVVPIETDDKGAMAEFLFVPFFGACIHVPPPPPNQVVYVRLAKPVQAPELGDASELQGTLRVKRFDGEAASAAYTMDDAVLTPKE